MVLYIYIYIVNRVAVDYYIRCSLSLYACTSINEKGKQQEFQQANNSTCGGGAIWSMTNGWNILSS